MILEEIKTKLEEIDPNVFYGAVNTSMRDMIWDYIVFHRTPTKINENKTVYNEYFSVNVIRENFVPEDLYLTVIDKMLEINGMRLSGSDIGYEYTVKPNTDTVVEMLSIEFMKPKKKV